MVGTAGMESGPEVKTVTAALMAPEAGRVLMEATGITTITHFDGNPTDAAAALCTRLNLVLDANPWLGGRLVIPGWRKPAHLQWAVPHAPAFVPVQPVVGVHRGTLYADLAKAVVGAGLRVPAGSALARKSLPLYTLAVVPDSENPDSRFGVIFSLSHTIADGHTYYTLLNALSRAAAVPVLNPTRNQEFETLSAAQHPPEAHSFVKSAGFVMNVVGTLLLRKTPAVSCWTVDPAKVGAIKDAVAAEGETPFVSTNDAVTSAFSRVNANRVTLMAINWRERLAEIEENLAGNYIGLICMAPQDAERPALIRKAVQQHRRAGPDIDPFPSILERPFCRLGLITNWATFAGAFEIPGCTPQLQMPVLKATEMPFDIAVVFKPHPGRADTAVIMFSRACTKEDVVRLDDSPFGPELAPDLF